MIKQQSLCISATMIALSLAWHTPETRAEAPVDVQVSFPVFPVTVNGTAIDVRHSEYPLLVYKDITYFPMTWNHTSALGLTVEWDANSGLSLRKKDACVPLEQNLTPRINAEDVTQTAAPAPFPVKVNGKTVINAEEPYPVLLYRDITYFPMTWRFTNDEFGWITSWNADSGFGIESCGGLSNSQMKQADALNIANNGLLAVQGDWIFMNPGNKSGGTRQLLKAQKNGGKQEKLSDDNAMSINIVGDWLFYSSVSSPSKGIYKIKTDGTGRSQISAVPSLKLKCRTIGFIIRK